MARWALFSWAFVFLTATSVLGIEEPESKSSPAAEQMVASALKLELEGKPRYRDMILQAALSENPDCETARWQSGQVKGTDGWQQATEYDLSNDKFAALYASRRDAALGNPQREYDLAIWCERVGMRDRQNLHMMRVALQPGIDGQLRAKAIKKLKLQNVGGRLLTPVQVADLKTQQSEFQSSMEEWLPKVQKWLKAYAHRKPSVRERAVSEIAEINDPAAILTLEWFISPVDETLATTVVSVLEKIDTPAATASLARHAMGAPWESVSNQATIALKNRPLHEFVPMLLSNLNSPIQTVFQVTAPRGGGLQYRHFVRQEGAEADRVHQTSFELVRASLSSTLSGDDAYIVELASRQMAAYEGVVQQIRSTEQTAAIRNERNRVNNDRLYAILERTTDTTISHSPRDWWDWWIDYNGVEMGTRPLMYTYVYQCRFQPEYSGPSESERSKSKRDRSPSEPEETGPTEAGPTGPGGAPDLPPPSGPFDVPSAPTFMGTRLPPGECFPAGTPVWTELGLRRIEEIKIGDRVLSQDQESGELSYKTILNTTERPPTAMVRVSTKDGTVSATDGHPFWQSGLGWRMAKLLKEGDRIRTTNGSVLVQKVEKLPDTAAHNLIVDDFASYFVGKGGLLVHDGSYRSPSRAILPGLQSNQLVETSR